MNICPWCKAQNPPRAEICLSCGKKASDHPSRAVVVAGSMLDDAMESDHPPPPMELDFKAAPPKGISRNDFPAVKAPIIDTSADIHKAMDDWESFGEQNDAPLLDLAPVAPIERPSASKMKPTDKAAPPPKSSEEEIDAQDVKTLAKFGEPPHEIWRTPGYAIQVTLRQRELKEMLAGVRKSLGDAESRRDDRFIDLGQLMRPVAEKSAAMAAIVATIRGAEDARVKREQALANANTSFRDQAAALDQQIAALESPTKAARDVLEIKAKEHALAEELRVKAEGRTKALDAELKAATARFESPQTPSTEKASIYASMASTAGDRDARLADEQAATKVAQAADMERTRAKKALTDLEAQAAALAKKRADTERDFSKQGVARAEGVQAASREVKGALLELGKRTYPATVQVGNSDAVRRTIADAETQVKRLQKDLERHLRAVASADETSVKKGFLLIGAAILVFLIIVFVIFQAVHVNPYQPPPKTP